MERAQRFAAKIVRRVLAGNPLPAVLTGLPLPSGDRALAHELSYGTLRFLGELRAIVHALAERPLTDGSVEALLWVALYQLIHTGAPAHAVVDSAVRATAQLKRTSAQGLTNAILRTFLRRRDALLGEIAKDPEARFSYPRWWIDRVFAEYPQHAAAVLDAGNARPMLSLRVNRRQLAREDYLAALQAQQIPAHAIGETGVVLDGVAAVSALPGYAAGWFSVQDAGAQLAAPLLGARDGMRVLDACAAPGGKTTHLAELAALDLVALDVDAARIERVRDNLARLGLAARLVVADAGEPDSWWDGDAFDRILADVPCTASGIVRRHPDGKWLRRETDIAGFTAQQIRLLDALWPCLKRGGVLLYSTCSIFGAENDDQIAAFLRRHRDALRIRLTLPAEYAAIGGQLLPAAPGAAHNHDGFFYALLQKS
ncbi:MAG TPA: 16S rRNA (cytosine(967)-C(5))-methyltransferase RsmB [Casimicrobiaceae bacterium]|jgi:16S rRNA (cytosine967-C5)-methyltransferase|nr:16S rRNA (cytosine(967)-C(5))-methyltransferase RsmB [Casimicrobiaceae bacterium]